MERYSKSSQHVKQLIAHEWCHGSSALRQQQDCREAVPNGLDSWEWHSEWRTVLSEANTVRYMSDARVITLCKYVPLYAVSLRLPFCAVIREPRRGLQSVNIAAQSHKTYTWRTVWMRSWWRHVGENIQQPYKWKKTNEKLPRRDAFYGN